MASCGYHSPQFSEDAAWLPAWLQPHQLPRLGSEHKNVGSSQENVCRGQDSQLFTNNDAKYSGCRLYLSGEDGSIPPNSALSASDALNFRLHFSSGDTSIFASNKILESGCRHTEFFEPEKLETKGTQSGKADKTDNLLKKSVEAPYLHDDAVCLSKDQSPTSILQTKPEPKMSCKRISDAQNGAKRSKRRKLHRKPNEDKLSNAIELSISAAEATVISEILSCGLQSEQLPATEILEIALRVKQARNEALNDLEVVSSLSPDGLDETDQLSDLDETLMSDAFDDVGIYCTKTGGTPSSSNSNRKSLHSNSSFDETTRVSDSYDGAEKHDKKIQADCADANEASSKECALYAVESTSNNIHFKPPVENMNPSAYASLDCHNSCLRNPSIADAEKLCYKVDDFTAIQMDHGMHEGCKLAPIEVANIRRSSKAFRAETSFISESMDESTSVNRPDAELGTVASSSTPYGETIRLLNNETERNVHHKYHCSQDVLMSSSLSLVDPLCSIVPCSISSDDAPVLCDYNQKMEKEKEIVLKSAVTDVLVGVNGKTNLNNDQEIPLKPIVQGEADGSTYPSMPSRKKFSSLKPFSMVIPAIDTTALGPIPSHKNMQSIQFPPSERNSSINCNDNHSQLAKNHEGDCRHTVEESDDVGEPIINYENSPVPSINKKRRIRACKVTAIEEILKKSSAMKRRKRRTRNSANGVRCRNQTYVKSCNPIQPNLCSNPEDRQKNQKKRVRFAEAKTSIELSKNEENIEHTPRDSLHTTKRKHKQSSPFKNEIMREAYNYLTCSQTIDEKGMILQGLDFLLTGFSCQNEKELETLIRLYGGHVLASIPTCYSDLKGNQRKPSSKRKLPIVISPKKVQTTKYLYGCATNTWMLNAYWLYDSIEAGSLLPPEKYMTRPLQGYERNELRVGQPIYLHSHTFIFNKMGVMIHGKANFCTKFSKIIKHGGGQVFKSLQLLVQSLKDGTSTQGTVLVENEGNVSRHLKYCALENNLQTTPASWIVNSLFNGKLLPIKKDRAAALHRIKMPTFCQASDTDNEMSEEI